MSKTYLVTGSNGLIGSEAVRYFTARGIKVHGIDNNMRQYFFGPEASTVWVKEELSKTLSGGYTHHDIDIRDQQAVFGLFKENRFDAIIHCAAQPSHDWAAREPLTDFAVNANGTLNLLEAMRLHAKDAVMIFTSTNKVYGDTPNRLPLVEGKTRYDVDPSHPYAAHGIDENMSIDQSMHSVFGASKVAADILVQEYGRYFGLHTGVFRGGCLTGPYHSGAELHGFLAYLVKCILTGKPYTIFGYQGKQVRDNIHSFDLVSMFDAFIANPKQGAVYNAGGGMHSNISMQEAIAKIEAISGKKANVTYHEQNRAGDHIWYISDLRKFKRDYPKWNFTYDIDRTLEAIIQHAAAR